MISALDRYFDAAPRFDADALEIGAFTLFLSHAPYPYYARPSRSHSEPIVASDLVELEQACKESNVGLTIEWVVETHPELGELAEAYGLQVKSHALLIASAADIEPLPVAGVSIRIANAGEAAIEHGRAVAEVSFNFGGTHTGLGGPVERDAIAVEMGSTIREHMHERNRRGLTVTAVAETSEGVIAVGCYQPIDGFAEIVGVATLPSARRRGLAGALTSLLTSHALDNGVETVLLSAQNEDVARVYERIGFRRVGSTGAAERATQ